MGSIRLALGSDEHGLALRGVAGARVDGLRIVASGAPLRPPAPAQPNGVIGIDHVVVATPAFERTSRALADAGLERRRVRETGSVIQGFYVIGDALLEVAGPPGADRGGPASLWGVTFTCADLEATCAMLGPERVGSARDAVQPGRRIATVRGEVGLGLAVALMTPR